MADKENEPEDIISLEAVREFLLKNDGKVKQSDLINYFRQQLSGSVTKGRARQEFKDILQLITAVKIENGTKYIVLIKQAQEHLQTCVKNRKASRPLLQRKDLARSKLEYLHAPSTSIEQSDDDDSPHGSTSTLASSGVSMADSGIASETSGSVSSLRSALSDKLIKGTHSLDSINTVMTDEDVGELEDELGLNDGCEVLPEEKEWMLAASRGDLETLKKLLKLHPHLARKRDFVMGYTALHWASKLGRADIVKFIAAANVDIHSKSHGGYTALHLASMSGKENIIIQLIDILGASIHARDHSGRKPKDIVKETVAADVQRKLGRSLILEPDWVMSDAILVRKQSVQQHTTTSLPAMQDRRFSKSSSRKDSSA